MERIDIVINPLYSPYQTPGQFMKLTVFIPDKNKKEDRDILIQREILKSISYTEIERFG